MRKTELPALMTIADTMAYLHCSRQHVYDLLSEGENQNLQGRASPVC